MIFGHKSLALFIDLFHCCAHTLIALGHYIPSTVMIWLTAGKEVSADAAHVSDLLGQESQQAAGTYQPSKHRTSGRFKGCVLLQGTRLAALLHCH